jgi:hypothetical protein
MYVDGPIYGEFSGNGAGLTNLDSIWKKIILNLGIYDRENGDLKVGIGTTLVLLHNFKLLVLLQHHCMLRMVLDLFLQQPLKVKYQLAEH